MDQYKKIKARAIRLLSRREYSINNDNWYKELFINGDIHLNSFGNEFAAKKILDTIIRTDILGLNNEN